MSAPSGDGYHVIQRCPFHLEEPAAVQAVWIDRPEIITKRQPLLTLIKFEGFRHEETFPERGTRDGMTSTAWTGQANRGELSVC